MNDFYLTLPSNVKTSGQQNTTARFTTLLPKTIDLPGQWYVGLVEIQFPFSWSNAGNSWIDSIIVLKHNPTNSNLKVSIPRSYYETIESLVDTVQIQIVDTLVEVMEKQSKPFNKRENRAIIKLMNSEEKIKESKLMEILRPNYKDGSERKEYFSLIANRLVTVSWNAEIRHVIIRLRSSDIVPSLKLSPVLQYMLGFATTDQNVLNITQNKTVAPYPPDIQGGLSALYIYSDSAVPQIVGDQVAPLLHVIPVNTTGFSYGQVCTQIFYTPHYIPVVSRSLTSIQISINTDQDVPVGFNFGKSIVKLHFVQKTPRLL